MSDFMSDSFFVGRTSNLTMRPGASNGRPAEVRGNRRDVRPVSVKPLLATIGERAVDGPDIASTPQRFLAVFTV
jgi:hypothetical protein